MQDRLKRYLIGILNLPKIYSEELDVYLINSRGILLFVLLAMSLGIMIVFGILSIKKGVYDVAAINATGAVVYFVLLIYLRKNFNHELISYLYAAILGVQFLYLIYSGGISNFGYVWTLLFPLGVLFFFGRNPGLGISIIFLVLATILLFTFSVYKQFGLEFHLRYIGIYSAITFISYTFELVRDKLNKTILEKNAELREAKNKAENADKLKSEFLAQMSHEIRTPINTILNYNSLIEAEFKDKLTGELADSFNSINKASYRLIRTIDMILNLSAIEAGSYEPYFEYVSLSSDIIIPVMKEFEQSAKAKNLYLSFNYGSNSDIQFEADRYTLIQAIANLVDNAIKYTDEGGVTVSTELQNGFCKIYISDTGIGIAELYLPKLFEKFSQETEGYTRKYDGSGLGLALVKKYCEVNNAEISVESQKGKGTVFTFTLNTGNK